MEREKNDQLAIYGKSRRSKAGYEFQENDSSWHLDKNITINVESVKDMLDESLIPGFIKTLRYYAENYSSHHVSNMLFRFSHYLKNTESNKITEKDLINYRTVVHEKQWYLGTIRVFLKKWNDLGYYGVSNAIIDLLNSWTLKGNEKGDLIKRFDPYKGPLNDNELQAVNEKSLNAYEQNIISLRDLALVMCLSHTGCRTVQLISLRAKDIIRDSNRNGDPKYLLYIPRAKQRNTKYREKFKQYAINYELWYILSQRANEVIYEVNKKLNLQMEYYDKMDLPLFPDMKAIKKVSSIDEYKECVVTDNLCMRMQTVYQILKKVVHKSKIYSERTNDLIALNAHRFRYTQGTRAAREGYGEAVIAELLDHSDTQNAGVYIENIPDHVEALNKAVGHYLAPYAQAFAGVLVTNETNAHRGDDLRSRIKAKSNVNIGNCGSYEFCGANVPIPCYTCIHFQPWIDGPHHLVLDELMAERERLKEITDDLQMASINDRTIMAVQEVINLCESYS